MFTLDGRGIGLNIQIGLVPFIIILILAVAVYLYLHRHFWNVTEIEINGFGQKVKIKPDPTVSRIAHKAWTELRSRKAAIEFEPEHDVISEVYDSWYALFGEMRSLIKDIPAEQIRGNQAVRDLVSIMMDTLNEGLRPHLTEHQARFRRWLAAEIKRQDKLEDDAEAKGNPIAHQSIQDIQKRYPEYDKLSKHLLEVNGVLVKYAEALEIVAHGPNPGGKTRVDIPTPSDPTT